ncbi:MAG: hypothetical protein ACNI27_04460 [Desulfovibrio sp.]
MALMFGSPTKRSGRKEQDSQDHRVARAKDFYLSGKFKIVTTDTVPNHEVQGTFGLIVCRSYNFDNAFYGLIAQAMDVNADAILAYRENITFHPEGDKFYACYGTAVRIKKQKKVRV